MGNFGPQGSIAINKRMEKSGQHDIYGSVIPMNEKRVTIVHSSVVSYEKGRGFFPNVVCVIHYDSNCDLIRSDQPTIKVDPSDFHVLYFDAYSVCADCESKRGGKNNGIVSSS